MTKPALISIVLPAYNELENLKRLVPAIQKELKDFRTEILVVDDNSPDGTQAYFASQNLAGVKVVDRKGPKGFALSIRDGIEASQGNIIIIMDSDFNHQPKYLPILIDNLKYYDAVAASRFQYGAQMDGWFRHKASWIFNIVTRIITGGFITDHLYGFIAIKREVLFRVNFDKVFWGYGDYCIRLLYYLQRSATPILQIPAVNGRRLHGTANSRMVSVFIKYSLTVMQLTWRERIRKSV